MLPAYLSALRGRFTGTVTVLMTHTATRFLPPHTMGLFADRVVTGEDPSTWPADNHVTLAESHDMIAVLPATANTLAAVASGSVPNLLTATIATAVIPVVFFPVMTGEMWARAATGRNVEQLVNDGYQVVDPVWGPRYDVGLGTFVESPLPPPPPRFVDLVRDHLAR
jgi:phosphopantothenoylcysteine synthetase/decarboxylase